MLQVNGDAWEMFIHGRWAEWSSSRKCTDQTHNGNLLMVTLDLTRKLS